MNAWPHNQSAVAAVEMAIFDALTRYLNIPLWRLWNLKPKRLRTDITIVIADLEETKAKAREFKRQGFVLLKLK
jgi:L-alanine-DL-glutamate epimerase-like enolase superfamily enzyme